MNLSIASAYRRALVVAVIAGLSVTAGAAPASAGCPAGASLSESQLRHAERQLGQRVNDERLANGLPVLHLHTDIASVARPFAWKLEQDGDLSHNDAYFGMRDRFNASMLAENVGTSCSIDTVHQAFMDSPPHRANILNSKLTHIGLGAASSADGRLWVVEDFAAVRAAAPAPPPPAAAAPPPPPAAAQPVVEQAAPPVTVRQAAPAAPVRVEKPAPAPPAKAQPAQSPRVTIESDSFERIEAPVTDEAGTTREPAQLAAIVTLLCALGFVLIGRRPKRGAVTEPQKKIEASLRQVPAARLVQKCPERSVKV